jgi:hypothetical protein
LDIFVDFGDEWCGFGGRDSRALKVKKRNIVATDALALVGHDDLGDRVPGS